MTDDARDELRAVLAHRLNRRPELLRSRQHATDLADHLVPTVLSYLVDELALAADMLCLSVENPEQPWAQGVMFAVEALADRAKALRAQGAQP